MQPGIEIAGTDRIVLREAVRLLEGPSFTARLASLAGTPVAILGRALPQSASEIISRATAAALSRAFGFVLKTVPQRDGQPRLRTHQALASLSGAVGGAFGLASLPIELPVSTTIILRAIAQIAQSEGEDLSRPEAALACLQVFALGGQAGSPHLHESSYFAVRTALAKSVAEAARQIAGRGVLDRSAHAITRLLTQIGARFGITVSQKVAAQAVPVLGALGGAAVNAAFTNHFQSLARGHFIVRRLERTYGKESVRSAYEQIRAEEGL
nr:EcsC family protein [Geminicoccus roseus]